MSQKTNKTILLLPNDKLPRWAPVAWYLRVLEVLHLRSRRFMCVMGQDGVVMTNPMNLPEVSKIFSDEGYTVVTGAHRTLNASDRPRWAKSPNPHNFNTPKVIRPDLKPLPGGKQ